MGRDNGRTPMQWSGGEQAGFTTGEPWLKINPRYGEINAEEALADPESVFYYYQKLIELRHKEEILTEGTYRLLLPEDESIFAYEREWKGEMWLVAANLSEKWTDGKTLFERWEKKWSTVIANYPQVMWEGRLRPYEAFILRAEK